MGNKPTVYAVHARDLLTDRYLQDPICSMVEHPRDMTLSDAIACFKREVYAFSLQHTGYRDIKSIYLYENGWRVAKAAGERHERRKVLRRVKVEFRSPAYKHLWDEGGEALAPKRWPLCERMFRAAMTLACDDATSLTFTLETHI